MARIALPLLLALSALLPAPLAARQATRAAPQGFFASPIVLPGLARGAAAWGDYDGDGWLDIALTGRHGWQDLTRVYRNLGGSDFADSGLRPTSLVDSLAAWQDYDGDGRLDFFLAGYAYSQSSFVAFLYHNDGGGLFHVAEMLPVAGVNAAAWGDYDRDGRPDLLLTAGYTGSTPWAVTKLYRNDGNGTFTEVPTALPGVFDGSVAWGDYDGDGDPDVLIAGIDNDYSIIAQVFRNDAGAFVNTGQALLGVHAGDAAWGDYDGDGDPDIALSGTSVAGPVTDLYRNDAGTFNLAESLIFAEHSALAWGDYDNDGDLDLAANGTNPNGDQTIVYENQGGVLGVGASLPGTARGTVAWADYNRDGTLDLLAAGLSGDFDRTWLYYNLQAISNTVPTAPSNLRAAVDGTQVTLAWDAASDGQTPPAGLSYNVRVGTTPGGQDVMPAMADSASGLRRVPAPGNQGQRLSATLDLSSWPAAQRVYYWSVQAVDSGLAGGPFAAQGYFLVNMPYRTYLPSAAR